MKKLILSIITLIMLLAFTSCKNHKETVTPEQLCFDIQRIQIDLAYSSMKDMYDPAPYEQLKKDVMEGKLSRVDCVFELKKILSSYHVMHLNLSQIETEASDKMFMPFVFSSFDDGYHVFRADKKYEKYLGWKLKEFSGYSVEEARDKLLSFVSYETPSGAKRLFEQSYNYNQLKYAGLLDKKGRVKLCLESPDGKTEEISCSLISSSKAKFINIWPEKGMKYHPYCLNANYGILSCEEKRTLYIPYKSTYGIPDYPVTALISDILSEIKTGLYDTVVFDIRYNGGGLPREAIVFRHLFYDNREEFKKCNLAVVTGGWTYSAACWFLNDFIDVFPEAVIFGEETGQAVFNYTSVMPYELKYLKCNFIFPQAIDDNPVLKARAKDIYRDTMPDVEVTENFEDFMNGEDTIYKTIYDYFNK